MPSRGKKVSSVQHERQKLFWRHISGSSNIKLQHPWPRIKAHSSDFQPLKNSMVIIKNYLLQIILQLPVIGGPQRAEISIYDVTFV